MPDAIDGMPVTIGVMAKSPSPGGSKTRMCPPLLPAEAAAIAEAALADTLDVVGSTPAARRVVVLAGPSGRWVPDGFDVVPQRGDGLAERLAAAFQDLGGPTLLIDADTPQVTPEHLGEAVTALGSGRWGAVLGPAEDGGYWAIGLREPDRGAFRNVPMSSPNTCRTQLRRLQQLGLSVFGLPVLRDADTVADALAVAALIPGSRFARAVARAIRRLEAEVEEEVSA